MRRRALNRPSTKKWRAPPVFFACAPRDKREGSALAKKPGPPTIFPLQLLALLVVAEGQRGREWRSLATKGNKTMSNTSPLNAYAVKDRGKGKKAIWTRIGRAWPHKKGSGFNLELEALPCRRQDGPDAAQDHRSSRRDLRSGGGPMTHRSTHAADTRAAQAALTRPPYDDLRSLPADRRQRRGHHANHQRHARALMPRIGGAIMTRTASRGASSPSRGSRRRRKYCVRFTSITSYKLTLTAPSEHAAIEKAKDQWFDGDHNLFIAFAGDDHDWDAEEVQS